MTTNQIEKKAYELLVSTGNLEAPVPIKNLIKSLGN